MNRKKHFLLILFALILTFTMSFSLFACNRNTGDENEGVVDDKTLVANGSFSGVESETYPKVPSGWTGSAGSISGSQSTPAVQGEDLLSGVINIDDKIYKDNAKKWRLDKKDKIGKPNNDSKDNNLLMINNLKNTAYKYTSSSISLEKNSYYKVSMNVKTNDDANAFLYVLGDAYAEFENISTQGKWTTFEAYIETPINSNKSISITLSNGWGDKVNGVMSTGAVFFDDIKVEKIEKEGDDNYGKTVYNEKVSLDNSTTNNFATYSMRMPDAEFNYTSGSTLPFAPSKYRGYAGYSDSGNNAPTSSTYLTHGVVDTSKPNYAADLKLTNPTLPEGSLGTKMLFINNLKRTAYGYRSSVPFLIEAGKNYVFTVKVRTDNVTENGATVRLVESSTDNSKKNQISKIDTNGEWKTLTFNITGNQLSDKEIFFELWLGEGGVEDQNPSKDKTGWATGTVYMDQVTFGEVISADVSLASDPNYVCDADYRESIDFADNILQHGFFMNEGSNNGWEQMAYNEKTYDFYNDDSKVYHKVLVDKEGAPVPLPAKNIMIMDGETEKGVLNTALNIHVGERSAYGFTIKADDGNNFSIRKNSYYEFSMWVKTDMDKKFDGLGLTVSLMQKNNNKKNEDDPDKTVASFASINTREIEENNGYVKLTFYVEGSNVNDKDELYINVMLGGGSRFTPETHVEGDAYIALVNAKLINHEDYVKAGTSTYVKKNSLNTTSNSTTSIANGNFSDSDINATYDNYINYQGQDNATEDVVIKNIIDEATGAFKVPTAPTSWTISNKSYLEALTTGIVSDASQFANVPEPLKTNLENLISDVDGSALVLATKQKDKSSEKGYLTVPTSPETCGCKCKECIEKGVCDGKSCKPEDGVEPCLHMKGATGVLPVGYSSQSITLDANKFYQIKVRARAVSGIAYITLTGLTEDQSIVINADNNTAWQEVTFYINTGLSSKSVQLELYLGKKGSGEQVTGAVAFDRVSIIDSIEEKDYNKIEEIKNKTHKIPFTTETFKVDTPNTDNLSAAPSSWSGIKANEASDKADDLVKGVFDEKTTRNEWLKTIDTDGNVTYLPNDIYNNLPKNGHENFLVINNVIPNGYKYENGSSKTLAKDSYYKISVDVFTYGLDKDENAFITLKLNEVTYTFDKDSDAGILVNTSTYKEDGTEEAGAWTTYTFYVKTPDDTAISNVKVTLGLGKSSDNKDDKAENFVQGYAFFDNVSFAKLDDENGTEFNDAVESATTKKITATNAEMMKKPEPEKVEPETKPKNDLLWVYITSGVIGGLIIIVVIGVVLKKYWSKITAVFKKNKGKNLSEYDKNHPNNNTDANKKNDKKSKNNEFKD